MAKDVKFNIKLTIDGKQHIVEASTNVKKFAEELAIAQTSSNKLRDQLIKFSGIATSFQNLASGLQQLTGVAQTYIDANKVQVEAETKLETVMRQRMNATDDEIQSVKNLASAQQALGVIGDEVQLMGIQQVATFLKEKGSIDTLVPAMNNLLAQQKGLNATGQDAANIGNMLGKVMQGQTGALTRAGITFTEAQEKVLKFGTESERAAMLAQVITDNVGEMNAALAKTDAGMAKQAANDLGDLQEVIGGFIAKYEKKHNCIFAGNDCYSIHYVGLSGTERRFGIFRRCVRWLDECSEKDESRYDRANRKPSNFDCDKHFGGYSYPGADGSYGSGYSYSCALHNYRKVQSGAVQDSGGDRSSKTRTSERWKAVCRAVCACTYFNRTYP